MEYNISMEKFAQRLKELRIDKGLSIQALSKEVKIGVASICRWENQQADVKGTQLVALAKFFDVTIDYLLDMESYKKDEELKKIFEQDDIFAIIGRSVMSGYVVLFSQRDTA